MPFHPAPALPKPVAELLPLKRCMYELEREPSPGLELHFVDEGPKDGLPVVLLHGNPTWSFLWRKVIAELPRRRCLAPDLLGFGLSSRLPRVQDHTVERHADALVEWLDALELPRVILVGHDWGGPLAAAVASRRPDAIGGLVLCNTMVFMPAQPRRSWFHRLAHVPGVSELAFRGLGLPQNLMWLVQADRRSIRGRVASAYKWPLSEQRDRVGPLALARLVPGSPDHPAAEALRPGEAWLRGYDGPVALVWGTKDPVLGSALRTMEDALPHAPVTRTDAGHFLQEEAPSAVAAAIEDIVRQARRAASKTASPE